MKSQASFSNSDVAILLSRQPLRSCRSDQWIKNSVAAVRWIKENDYRLCSSVGMQTWELLTALASIENVPLKLFIPLEPDQDSAIIQPEITRQFELTSKQVEYVFVKPSSAFADRTEMMQRRDELIMESARILIPVSIRERGCMASYLDTATSREKVVENRFIIPYKIRCQKLAYQLTMEKINPSIKSVPRGLITHWTRTPNTAWPTERKVDYYRAILSSNQYPRTAFDTLCEIIRGRFLKASSKNMPQNIPVVSFTLLSPIELIPLMRWRARYRQMSFEPYGIAFDAKWARQQGIIPVRYYDPSIDKDLNAAEVWLRQSVGKKGDWKAEQEYRHLGDFDFSQIPVDMIRLYCHKSSEAALLKREFDFKTTPFVCKQV